MPKKPSYEELELKNKELESLLEDKSEKAEKMMVKFFDFSVDLLCVADMDGHFMLVNNAFVTILGYSKKELYERPYTDFVHPDDLDSTVGANNLLSEGMSITRYENRYRCKDGSYKWLSWTSMPIVKEHKNYAVARDITRFKHLEEDLTQKLKKRIAKRTAALQDTAQSLKTTNKMLKKKELELKDKNYNLEELNTACKVLIKHKDENRQELERKITVTMNTLIEPYLTKLAKICPETRQQNFIKIIDANLQEIISPFTRDLTSGYIYLTATEIQVADLIKHSHSNKVIAELMNLSPDTVIGHRKNIRKKLGITNTKTNLHTYLNTLKQ
jgi:PAS domain S-box-containing protein